MRSVHLLLVDASTHSVDSLDLVEIEDSLLFVAHARRSLEVKHVVLFVKDD